jgi:beta-xylosidase
MNAPNGDFMVEAKIEIHPLKHWQQAGLMVYWNDNDYLKIDYLLDSDRALKVEFSSESNGRYTKRFKKFSSAVVYLRIKKEGNKYTGWVSADGKTYQVITSHTRNKWGKLRVGLYAWDGTTSVRSVAARFDYFEVTKY